MILILMGVTGAGKTTVGRLLAAELGWSFFDGDDFHSPASVETMRRGIPLTDEDRRPWLESLREVIVRCRERGESAVLACSALKEPYRRTLRRRDEDILFVYLKADPERIASRLRHRAGHYAKADLLPSQLATLEEPADALTVDAAPEPEEIAREIRRRLGI